MKKQSKSKPKSSYTAYAKQDRKSHLVWPADALFVECVFQLLSWLHQGGDNTGIEKLHPCMLAYNLISIIISQSTYIKLAVVYAGLLSMLDSVACNKLIRLLKSEIGALKSRLI